MSELEKISTFRYKLAVAETFEELSFLGSASDAWAEFARKEKLSLDKQNEIGQYRIEVMEKLGSWLDEKFPHGAPENNTNALKNKGSVSEPLFSMPVSKHESSRARTIANADSEAKSRVIKQIKASGDVITPHRVAKDLKREEQEQRRQAVKNTVSENISITRQKKYRVVYADPPWYYGNDISKAKSGSSYTRPEDHYPTMKTSEICDLPVRDIVEDNAVLFIWVTSPLLEESFSVVNAWGFTYKTSFVWDKVGHNFGHYNSVRHEFLLICTKGSCTPDNKKLIDSVQTIEKSRTHSEKPVAFYEIIESMYTQGGKIELFARSKREGWDSFGNQLQ